MSLKILTSEYMLSDTNGLGPARRWFPRIVDEAFLESTKDGEIQRAPDAVTMIDGELYWYNQSDDPQVTFVQVHRGPRSVVSTSPNTVVIHDSWSYASGVSPTADYPSIVQDTFGGKLKIDRDSVAPDDLQYARFFLDGDDSQVWIPTGQVPPRQALHFRYICSVQTPGVWITPSDIDADPRYEAQARWTRLRMFAAPIGAS